MMGSGLIVKSIIEAEEEDNVFYDGYDVIMTVGSLMSRKNLPYPEADSLDWKSSISKIEFQNLQELRSRILENEMDFGFQRIQVSAIVQCNNINEASAAARNALIHFAKYILNAASED